MVASIDKTKKVVYVCSGSGCTAAKSQEIIDIMQNELLELGCDVEIIKTGCFGICSKGPMMVTEPDGSFYVKLSTENAARIAKEHLHEGNPVKQFLYRVGRDIISLDNADFYKSQERVALKRSGKIDPKDIDAYIADNGFLALEKTFKMGASDTINLIKESGLKGRGGGGFLTGEKWEIAGLTPADKRYIICNADEGDPGSFMDRAIIEGDPFSIIEALTIAAYAVNSNQGYIYIRPEYSLAIELLKNAINLSTEKGYLGDNILGSGFDFSIEIRYGAGTFVGGEETAIINTLEGKRGVPNIRATHPSREGLFGYPTIINNVETLTNVPKIIAQGADWYRSFGSKESAGTKIFGVSGNIANIGLVEVPFGTTIRELIDMCGGIPRGRALKAVHIGGPSGGTIPASLIDTPLEYEKIRELGAMIGSGDFIVLDERKCMVHFAKFFMEFLAEESCGKCSPCRIGVMRMKEILTKICEGQASMKDLAELEELTDMVSELSMCGLGKEAPNPVTSTLKYFRDEYIAHIEGHKCQAGECEKLTTLVIENNCIGCTKCAQVCPVAAISGDPRSIHILDPEVCINCNSCVEACPVDAIRTA